MIHVLSVEHTGTWFCFDLIKQLTGKDVILASEFREEVSNSDWRESDLFNKRSSAQEFSHFHIPDRSIPLFIIDYIIRSCKVVIPVRDPVSALISDFSWPQKAKAGLGLVNGYDYLCEIADASEPNMIFWMPVDLYATKTVELRKAVLKLFSLFINGNDAGTDHIAQEWAPINETASEECLVKQAYLNGDWRVPRLESPEAFDLLTKPSVERFLRKIGYTNLPWFSQNLSYDRII